MAQQLAGQISVLELVNEAGGWVSGAWADAIRGFWQDGYAAVRKQGRRGRLRARSGSDDARQWETA
jgi:hypothetical protein